MDRRTLWIYTDNYKRAKFIKFEIKRLMLKSNFKNKTISNERRLLAKFLLSRVPRISSGTFINNICINSGRSHGIDKHTKFSRFRFRTSAYNSLLPGFTRANW